MFFEDFLPGQSTEISSFLLPGTMMQGKNPFLFPALLSRFFSSRFPLLLRPSFLSARPSFVLFRAAQSSGEDPDSSQGISSGFSIFSLTRGAISFDSLFPLLLPGTIPPEDLRASALSRRGTADGRRRR